MGWQEENGVEADSEKRRVWVDNAEDKKRNRRQSFRGGLMRRADFDSSIG